MFYTKLLDVMRSPELIKYVTKSLEAHVMTTRAGHVKEQVWVVKRDMFIKEKERAKKEIKDEKKKKEKRGKFE